MGLLNLIFRLYDMADLPKEIRTCIAVYAIWLAMILSNFMMNEAYDIGSDGCLENSWQAQRFVCRFTFL